MDGWGGGRLVGKSLRTMEVQGIQYRKNAYIRAVYILGYFASNINSQENITLS